MDVDKKAMLIGCIISHLKFHAQEHDKAFDEGDTFFSLAFKSDAELETIAKLTGV